MGENLEGTTTSMADRPIKQEATNYNPNAQSTPQPPTTASKNLHSASDLPTESTLIKAILARHTTRAFYKDKPVPLEVVEQCLDLAQHSPSSTNLQPWRLTFTSGPKLERLRQAMTAEVEAGVASTVPAIPDDFRRYRSELGHVLYGPEGWNIPRADKERMRQAQLRNYTFFDAPLVAVVGVDHGLNRGADTMSVGLYVQTLVLLLTERGLATCLEVSTSGYAQVLKRELGIADSIDVLCTLAIGYEDQAQQVNIFKMPRDTWRDHVDFVMD